MRAIVAFALVSLLLVPSAAPKGIPSGDVIYARWMVGGRFTREEWLERSTEATHRIDTGGPSCARATIANRRAVSFAVCAERGEWNLHRVRAPGDRVLLDSSDLLRPRRLLALGRATVEGTTVVDGLPATRVRIPWRYGIQYADLDPVSRLPLRFVFLRNEAVYESVYKLAYRSKRRSSLPRDFFLPRR